MATPSIDTLGNDIGLSHITYLWYIGIVAINKTQNKT